MKAQWIPGNHGNSCLDPAVRHRVDEQKRRGIEWKTTRTIPDLPWVALALNHQMTVRISQNQRTLILGRFDHLSFEAMVVDRFSFKENKWLTITLA